MSKKNDKPWRDAAELIRVYSDPGIKSDGDVARYFSDRGYNVSRRAITDARNAFSIPPKKEAAFISIPEEESEFNAENVWSLVSDLQAELRKKNTAKKSIDVKLTSDEPIGFFFMGDLHIGDIGTDHKALLRDVELIQKTEGLYGALGGDYINNFILGGKKIKNHEVLPVEFAWELTADLFKRLNDSLVMILLGNHDAWSDVAAEVDVLGEIVNKIGVPYGKHGTNVNISFPSGQDYKIRLRHKYQFNSNQNLLNSVKQMYRFDEDFDIGVLHHLHTPGIEMFPAQRGMCWALRPGSYKAEDDYSYELGFSKSGFGMSKTFHTDESCRYSVPMAILFPNERRIQVLPSIRDGVEFLGFVRDEHNKGEYYE